MEEFIPTTYRMDVRAEREAFFAHQEGKIHISFTLTHPDATMTQHWFNWICVWLVGSSLK